MDAFFASVEQLDHPELRGLPVLVGHDGPRGVVAAASYESRPYGCRSAQPTAVAKRMCPHAIVVPPRFRRYREVSDRVFAVFRAYTPIVEPLSVDEAFLDVAGTERLFGSAVDIAKRIKQDVKERTQLTASVGVSHNKFLAKLASDLEKPDGLTVIGPADVDRILPPLPVTKLWGVGPKTASRLEGLGIKTIADLRRMPVEILRRRFGEEEADHYIRLAHGRDVREVMPDHAAKSIGQEETFGHDLDDPEAVRGVMLEQCEHIASRLRASKRLAKTVTVKIRFGDFQTITRRMTLPAPTDTTPPIWDAARSLFNAWAAQCYHPIRLIGVQASSLGETTNDQLDLFPDTGAQRQRKLESALDVINQRFGKSTVHRARPERPPE